MFSNLFPKSRAPLLPFVSNPRRNETASILPRFTFNQIVTIILTSIFLLVFIINVTYLYRTEKPRSSRDAGELPNSKTIAQPPPLLGEEPNSEQTIIIPSTPNPPEPASGMVNDMLIFTQKPSVPISSSLCEYQFGNGFTQSLLVCTIDDEVITSPLSTFHCLYNALTASTTCKATKIMLDVSLMQVSRGDEEITAVLGRAEADEFIQYHQGAFVAACKPHGAVSTGDSRFVHHIGLMARSITFASEHTRQCSPSSIARITIPTLLVTRYEYANLYHSMTDWYNVYQTIQMFNLSHKPYQIIFMDGHSKGALDIWWELLFNNNNKPIYIKHLSLEQICYNEIYIVSPGYGSALSISQMSQQSLTCNNPSQLVSFIQHVRKSFGLNPDNKFNKNYYNNYKNKPLFITDIYNKNISLVHTSHNDIIITFVVRRPYLAHPRVQMGRMERTMSNEDEQLTSIQQLLKENNNNNNKINYIFHAYDLTTMNAEQQMLLMSKTDILIGIHGAALSYILFMHDLATLIEIIPQEYSTRVHFQFFSQWSNHTYIHMKVSGGSNGYQIDTNILANHIRDTAVRIRNNRPLAT